jgi:hypothetical protein
MPPPKPEPGLVVNYSYLWHYEHEAGHEEGRKDRPSVIILYLERRSGSDTVVVLPITYRRPERADMAVEELCVRLLAATPVQSRTQCVSGLPPQGQGSQDPPGLV